jgi:thiol-disulfide isomerase/thioredoxin
MIVGIGQCSGAESVTVRWPSGKTLSVEGVAEGTLVTAYENRSAGAFTRQPYRNARTRAATPVIERVTFPISTGAPGMVQVYTTTATWCAACLSHLPALGRLKQDGVALYGVPIDVNDDAQKLTAYVAKKKPPYQMLAEINADEKAKVTAFFARALQMQNPVLPSSVITDGDGNVLEVMQGIPTLSQVRKWMNATK